MNAKEKTLSFLTSILVSLGASVKGRAVVIETEDGEDPIVIDGKTLVMPTDETLKLSNWDTEIPFFPLCESILRGESEVQQELLDMIRSAVNIRLASLVWQMFKVANSDECKANKLSPEQAEFLPCLPGFDAEMVKRIGKVVLGVDPSEYKSSLVHMNLKRRAKINGKAYDRACLVRFPLAEMERKEKPYSADLRVKDMDALTNLLDYVLPNWQVENTYSRGTDSQVAPYFVASLLAYQNINARITELAKRFEPTFPIFGTLVNEDDWVECMDDLSRMRDSMPNLPGNDGKVVRGQADAPIIDDPKPARGVQMPTPSAAPQRQPGSLPWEDQPQQEQRPVERRVVDDEAVEYKPRQQPQYGNPGHIPVHQPVHTGGPNGYGNQNHQPSFAELQRQRQQGHYGYATVNTQPEVGGSPFSSSAQPGSTTNVGNYNVSYTTANNGYSTQPQGRGY
jgi:hypothetical protein